VGRCAHARARAARLTCLTVRWPRYPPSFVLCYLLPAYSSYKALRTGSRKAVIKLLMYWTVLSIFKGGEVFCDFFLGWYVHACMCVCLRRV
jgi:hypothetical protein